MLQRLRHDLRGAAAVEFALVAPILFFLIYGAVSYGIVLSVKHVMTEAAAEGARAAIGAQIIPGTDADQNAAYVRVAAARAGGSLGVYKTWAQVTPTVGTCPNAAPNQGSTVCVTVTLTYPYSTHPIIPNAPGLGLIMPSTLVSSFSVEVQ